MRVVLSGYSSGVAFEILDFLSKHISIDPVYLLVYDDCKSNDSPYSTITHQVHKMRRGISHSEEFSRVEGINDDEFIAYIEKYKARTLAMMGRQTETGYEFGFSEREHLFYYLVNYWWKTISFLDPEVLISRNIPHFAAEYLLFKIAEYKGVKTIALEEVAPFGGAYFISSLDVKSPILIPKDISLFSGNTEKISDIISKEMTKVKGSYKNARPDYYIDVQLDTQKAKTWPYVFHRLLKDFVKSVIFFGRKHEASIKRNKHPIYSDKSLQTHFSFSLHRWKARKLINKNHDLYLKLAGFQLPDSPFILFAPNYQPERTTMPDAHDHYDMLKIVDVISSILPVGWKIVYKEHPSVFNVPGKDFFRGHLFRNEEFYKSLKRYDNVVLLDHRYDTFNTIDKAEMVVSGTGTVCYEASMRGKKAVLFGNTWFSSCYLIHLFSSRKLLTAYLMSEVSSETTKGIWENYIKSVLAYCFKLPDLLNKKPGKFSDNNRDYLMALKACLESISCK